jgi:hypothetical protein
VPSAAHQALLLWAARKMATDGFRLAGYEGESDQGGVWNELANPPILAGVRPDAWGFDGERVAFAEAKTARDIDTTHTRVQLLVFARTRMKGTEAACQLYLAIPRSAAPLLDCVLADLGLVGLRNLVRLHVPDILLNRTS